jgi:hypothetical protein
MRLAASVIGFVGLAAACGQRGEVVTAPATPTTAATPVASVAPPPPDTPPMAHLSITCHFDGGWAVLVPAAAAPEVSSAAWAAIGAMRNQDDAGVAAKQKAAESSGAHFGACAPDVTFDVTPGTWTLMVERLRPMYGYASINKTLDLAGGDDLSLSYGEADVPQTSMCCHCPFVDAYDPAASRYGTAFEILKGRSRASLAGVERTPLVVVVRDHRVRVRVREIEDEVTFLDSIALETPAGKLLAPAHPLATVAVLQRGDARVFDFADPDLPDGETRVVLVATGHYEPLLDGAGAHVERR